MEAVVIVVPKRNEASFLERLQSLKQAVALPGGGIVVEAMGTRVYVRRDESISNELEWEDRRRYALAGDDPAFYSVEFADVALCRSVLERIADDPTLVVDNAHGLVLNGAEFVRCLRAREDWDWRLGAGH